MRASEDAHASFAGTCAFFNDEIVTCQGIYSQRAVPGPGRGTRLTFNDDPVTAYRLCSKLHVASP